MSCEQTARKIIVNSQAETEKFAAEIGAQLKGGEVIELVGDVGSGKTTFVRGLARGAGSKDSVSSPTFTVSQVYKGEKVKIYHYDFYRLDDFAMIQAELAENLEDANSVAVLEWAEEVRGLLPLAHLRIEFTVTGENERAMAVSIPTSYAHINIGGSE